MSSSAPTERFSTRVAAYVRYRPSYPPELYAHLATACALTADSVVADIGSGTGLLTQLFLTHGHAVFGVEPNAAMRAAGEAMLADYPRFTSVAGTAEATTLPTHAIDMLTAGQAFHWFDVPRARAEFQRILKPASWVALIWNERRTAGSEFLVGYEALLHTYSTDYAQVNYTNVTDADLAAFFAPNPLLRAHFDYAQRFDYAGLEGRLRSSSYAPEPGHPNHTPMLTALRALFDAHQQDGLVDFLYDTEIYYGQLS